MSSFPPLKQRLDGRRFSSPLSPREIHASKSQLPVIYSPTSTFSPHARPTTPRSPPVNPKFAHSSPQSPPQPHPPLPHPPTSSRGYPRPGPTSHHPYRPLALPPPPSPSFPSQLPSPHASPHPSPVSLSAISPNNSAGYNVVAFPRLHTTASSSATPFLSPSSRVPQPSPSQYGVKKFLRCCCCCCW